MFCVALGISISALDCSCATVLVYVAVYMHIDLPRCLGNVALLCVCLHSHLVIFYAWIVFSLFASFFIKHSYVWISELGASCLRFASLDGEFLESVTFVCLCFLACWAKFTPTYLPFGIWFGS